MRRLVVLILLLVMAVPSLAIASREQPPADGDFDIILQDGNTTEIWWIARYLRFLPSGAGWTDGDRSGYFCSYMFLLDQRSRVVGRVTFTRVDVPRESGGNYAYIKDEDMNEGSRFFDGTLAPVGSNELGDCPPPSQTYELWSGPDQRPTITFQTRKGVPEVRDYKATVAHPDVMFRQVEVITTPFTVISPLGVEDTVYRRVTVVAYVRGLPTIVIYYDSLVSAVSVVSDIS